MTERRDHPQDLLAAYVLGACPPDEAERVAEHLGSCPDCRRDAERLGAGAHVLLSDVAAAEPPRRVREGVLAQARTEAALFDAARSAEPGPEHRRSPGRPLRLRSRLRARPRTLALASALLLAAAGGGYLAGALRMDAPRTVTARVDDRARGASATLEINDERARLKVDGLPQPGRGRVYQLWVRKGREVPQPAGATFRVDPSGAAETPIPRDISEVDEVLVTSEPEGGSTLPTRVPLLQVDISA